jgi:excisionase family DNA binding protein
MVGKRRQETKVLDMDANMQGTIVFAEPVNLRIHGSFDGELKTRGTLLIGETAVVNAAIDGEDITIAGKVKGNVSAHVKLTLLATAVLEGNMSAPMLEIRAGAVFEGMSNMFGETLDVNAVSRYLDIEEQKIVQWANQGAIPAVRNGDSWMFDKRRIDSWIKENAHV